ncbi:MAG: hypothetical protein ACRDIC_12610, partial [bacterium]
MSQQHRHEYAAGFPRGLPARQLKTSPKVPAIETTTTAGRTATGPDPPDFEPVSRLKDVTTPVPHVLLFAIAPQAHAI